MNWQYTPYVFPVLIGAIISTLLSGYAWQRRQEMGALSFAALMLAVTGWSLGYAVELGGQTPLVRQLGLQLAYTGSTAVPLFWCLFALQYARQGEWLTRGRLTGLLIVPILTLFLAWTNSLHGWVWQQMGLVMINGFTRLWPTYGWWFWFYYLFTYALLLGGTVVLLLAVYQRAAFVYQEQSVAFLAGVLTPWGMNALYALHLTSLDWTPFGFALGGLLVVWDISRSHLFDTLPVAQKTVWEKMHDAMFMLDRRQRIVSLNPAALVILGQPGGVVIGRPLPAILPGIAEILNQLHNGAGDSHLPTQIELGQNGQRRTYELQVTTFQDRLGQITGRLLLLRDVTARQQAEAAVHMQKQLLESLVTLASTSGAGPTLQADLRQILTEVVHLTSASSGSLYLLDARIVGTQVIWPTDTQPENWLTTPHPAPAKGILGQGVVDSLLHTGQRMRVDDVRDAPQWSHMIDANLAVRSLLVAPLRLETSGSLGVLLLCHQLPGHFSEDHAALSELVADQMALVVQSVGMLQQQQRLNDRQIVTFKLLRAMGESLEPERVAFIAVETVAELTGWPAVAISVLDTAALPQTARSLGEQDRLTIQASVGVLTVDEGVNGRAFRTGMTQIWPDGDTNLATSRERGGVAVPLRRGRQCLGVFNVELDSPARFTQDDILLAESLTEVIVLALDNARLYAEMEQRLREQMVLRRAGDLIASTLDLPTVLSTIAEQMGHLVDATSVYMCRYDAAHGTALVLAEYFSRQTAPYPPTSHLGLTYDLEADLPGTAVSLGDGQPITLPVSVGLTWRPDTAVAHNLAGTILLVPLQVGGQTIAFAELWESRQPRVFTAEEIALCQAIARPAAVALEKARLFQVVAEERVRLRALIEADRDGIVLIGTAGHILVINQPAVHFLQLNGQATDWTDCTLMQMLLALRRHTPKMTRAIFAEIRRLHTGQEPANQGEFEIASRAIHWRNLPVMDGSRPLGRLIIMRDVTEERLLERMRDDLTHTMIHDLRGPLTAISVSLHLLDTLTRGANDERSQQTLRRAHRSMETVLELVNAILDISRLESGHMNLDRHPIGLPDLVSRVVESYLPLIDEKRLQVELHMAADLPLVYVDMGLMERVLQNLIGNAIKFTGVGGEIRVRAERDTAVPGTILVSLCDTGLGIPEAIRDRLFQKFTRGGQVGSGSGLGLYFCKMVLESHHQRIWLGQTSPQGTTFQFTLPTSTAVLPLAKIGSISKIEPI